MPLYFRSIHLALILSTSLGIVPLVGCSGSDDETSETSGSSEPWTARFIFGNFAINSGNVLTNEDGSSDTYLSDYVLSSDLPAVNFEFLSVHVYLPSSDVIETTVTDMAVTVRRTDGSSSGNIFQGGDFVQTVVLGDQQYSVFQIRGFTTATPPITVDSFANVTFDFTVRYLDGGNVLHSSERTVEIYKR